MVIKRRFNPSFLLPENRNIFTFYYKKVDIAIHFAIIPSIQQNTTKEII